MIATQNTDFTYKHPYSYLLFYLSVRGHCLYYRGVE